LIQKSKFPFEIIIHDDASKDGSKDIIERFREKYPSLIKLIIQDENVYSKDKQAPLRNCLDSAEYDYIALCEGDDFWFDPEKLEKQMNVLLSHKDLSMVVAPGLVSESPFSKKKLHCYHGADSITFNNINSVLYQSNQFAPTASYLFKRSILNFLYSDAFSEMSITDLFIEIYAIRLGGIIYIPEIMSYYRLASFGSWSEKMRDGGTEALIEYYYSLYSLIDKDPYLRSLNWERKLAIISLSIALSFLKNKDYKGFKSYLTLSRFHHNFPQFKFRIIYMFSQTPSLLNILFTLLGRFK
jgi:glycosyltransferase involved in cell wall biosynthesis